MQSIALKDGTFENTFLKDAVWRFQNSVGKEKKAARSVLPEHFLYPPGVMDVCAVRSFFQGFKGLPEVFGPDVRTNDPRTSAGYRPENFLFGLFFHS